MMGEDAPQRDYGAVERMMQDQSTTAKARPTIPKFVLTLIVVLLLGTACVLAVALHRADKQMSQVNGDDLQSQAWNLKACIHLRTALTDVQNFVSLTDACLR